MNINMLPKINNRIDDKINEYNLMLNLFIIF